jgi:hypothetical protein
VLAEAGVRWIGPAAIRARDHAFPPSGTSSRIGTSYRAGRL